MDHLKRYNPAAAKSYEIPYLCRGVFEEDLRDSQTLKEYPRTKTGFIEDGNKGLLLASDTRSAAMMQNWMYFGFLGVFLFIQGTELDREAFITKNTENKEVVTSKLLPSVLDKWMDAQRTRDEHETWKRARFDIAKDVIDYVQEMVNVLAHNHTEDELAIVLSSIQILTHTVIAALKDHFWSHFLGLRPSFGASNVFLNLIRQNGWCPYDISILTRNFYIDLHFYCSEMPAPRQDISHADCDDFRCIAMNIDEATYKTKHTSEDCNCDFLETPLEILHGIVESSGIPVIRYNPPNETDHKGHIIISQKIDQSPNVVFSHVWKDGLGNTAWINALPICKLSELQRLANTIYKDLDDTNNVPFWIDTMCVPQTPALRSKAIGMMRSIYKEAGRILVIDREICAVREADDMACLGVAIAFSGWMRRLWTYQEGILNPAVCFRLRDGIISLEKLKSFSMKSHSPNEIQKQPSASMSVANLTLAFVIRTLDVMDECVVSSPLSLVLICNSLQWRSTSRRNDEALVISNIYGHDLQEIQQREGLGRMQLVLHRIRRIPLAFIVRSSDRMPHYPYRWAPKSLLGENKHDNNNALSAWYSKMLRMNTGQGGHFPFETNIAEIQESGVLRSQASGFAIFPQGDLKDTIHQSFSFSEFHQVHKDLSFPVERCSVKCNIMQDASGYPPPLPRKPFLLIAIEDRPQISAVDHATMTVAIVLPDDRVSREMDKQKDIWTGHFTLGDIHCKFFCRATLAFSAKSFGGEVEWLAQQASSEEAKLDCDWGRQIPEHVWYIS